MLKSLKFIFPAGIQGQIDYLMGPLCADAPVELDCMTNFPMFWTAIAKGLFDPALGWFAPASMCGVII